jgi:hypothetical protein
LLSFLALPTLLLTSLFLTLLPLRLLFGATLRLRWLRGRSFLAPALTLLLSFLLSFGALRLIVCAALFSTTSSSLRTGNSSRNQKHDRQEDGNYDPSLIPSFHSSIPFT